MPDTITDGRTLQEVIGALPPPKPGYVRVFRGQNRDYPTMTPTGLRTTGSHDFIWPLYARRVAEDLVEATPHEAGDDLSAALVWVYAIKQHYGPGTRFLDVTHSPGVAAWFALHGIERHQERAIYGPPGPFDIRTDVVGQHDLLRYVEHRDIPGFLYVMDALPAAGLQLEHGTLFDLSLAPPAFSSSPRIRAQSACLMYADDREEGGNLAKHFVPGTPLRVGWPLSGCEEASWHTNDMFPPPPSDDWYARLVAVPLAPDLAASSKETTYAHPIKVSLYIPEGSAVEEDSRLLEDLTHRFTVLRPPLLHAAWVMTGKLPANAGDERLWRRLPRSTPLLIEGPLLTALPPLDSPMWNLGLLVHDLEDAAPAWDQGGRQAGRVDLRNVFIELSGLDATGWERAEREDKGLEIARAIWVLRDRGQIFVTLAIDRFPSGGYVIGPFEIQYDRRAGAFSIRGTSPGAGWVPLANEEFVARLTMKGLALIRFLSPRWKLSAVAQTAIQNDDQWISFVSIEWALAQIIRLSGSSGPLRSYYALREWGTKDPFIGGVSPSSIALDGALRIEGEPFASMDPEELRTTVSPQLAALQEDGPEA